MSMNDLFGGPPRDPVEPLAFDEWMRRYIDHIANEARMDRAAAEEIVRSAGEDCYREWFDDGVSPEDAADEELQEWVE